MMFTNWTTRDQVRNILYECIVPIFTTRSTKKRTKTFINGYLERREYMFAPTTFKDNIIFTMQKKVKQAWKQN